MPSLFVTEVYHNRLKFDLSELYSEALQIQKADQSGRKWSSENYPSGYTSYGSWDQLHKLSSNFALLESKISEHVYKYAKQLEYDIQKTDLKVNSIWLNIMKKGAQHTAHIHPYSVISGTFYVRVPAGSSSIKFEDPRLGFFMNSPQVKKKASQAHQRFVSLQPKAGDIVLFESWLKHEVPRQNVSQERVSISFNYGWA